MIEADGDVLILGSGFGGCLTALVLHQIGWKPIVIDRSKHPRFAIGESSTPASDLMLGDLCARYSLSRLAPLTHYGTWKRTYPEVTCGKKRGFSYFEQPTHVDFTPHADHRNELLVAASADEAGADTHWFRADVDAFFADEVRRAGIPLLEETELTGWHHDSDWTLTGTRHAESVRVRGEFVLDATGEGRLLCRWLGIAETNQLLRTNSRAVFSHFSGMKRWEDVLADRGANHGEHPFPCDDAALHHLFDCGWMYQLPFDNGVTSAGFVIDSGRHPLEESVAPEAEWNDWLARYPAVAEQFSSAKLAPVPGRICRSGRLQRRAARAAGRGWALLPHSAGFIDPFYSTGFAHTMSGIEIIGELFERRKEGTSGDDGWEEYSRRVLGQLELIDLIVWNSFRTFRNFRLFTLAAMFYFAAATTFERERLAGRSTGRAAGVFMSPEDREFRAVVDWFSERLTAVLRQLPSERLGEHELVDELEGELRERLRPFNHVGLLDRSARNMYRYTATEK